jgi:RNA polymerase sigma factor (TIGR02999 family)
MDAVAGDLERLAQAVYPELREMAGRLLRRERNDHTLQRTALVNEAFVRLFKNPPKPDLSCRELYSLAAHQMRNILIDYGRRHSSLKRGGDFVREPLFEADRSLCRNPDSLLALNEALDRLGMTDSRALSVVELKFFGGYTNAETAAILGFSDGTVEENWQFARSWLYGVLSDRGTRS